MANITARQFLEKGDNTEFLAACASVRVHSGKDKKNVTLVPSIRQVRKWRRHTGAAWKEGRGS